MSTLWHTKFDGVVGFIQKTRKFRAEKSKEFMDDFVSKEVCSECEGKRLKKESLNFKINDTSIADLNSMSIKEFSHWIDEAKDLFENYQKQIAEPILKEIKQGIDLIISLGLDYLCLDNTRTLSGGESREYG